jgi:hypothetical protein
LASGRHRSFERLALERCWTLLYRIWIAGDDPQYVARTLRQFDEGVKPQWMVAPLPADAAKPRRPRITIADLELSNAGAYPSQLETWCRATLESLGQPSKAA